MKTWPDEKKHCPTDRSLSWLLEAIPKYGDQTKGDGGKIRHAWHTIGFLHTDGTKQTGMGCARSRNHAHTLESNLSGVFASVVDPVSVVPVASLVLAAVDLNYTGPSSAATWKMSVSVDVKSSMIKTYRVCRNIPGN
jgi:hypothetical protein